MRLFRKRKKQAQGLEKYSYGDFLILLPLCTEEVRSTLIEYLNTCERPKYINDTQVAESLNGITYGQLDDLSHINKQKDPLLAAIKILFGLDESKVYELPVTKVFGIRNFVTKEVDRINKLFSAISLDHTADEVSAGIEELNFGSFGVLDWYARRMRITNQNDVRSVSWVRIYQCMKNDTAQVAYERRYNQVMLNKSKARRK